MKPETLKYINKQGMKYRFEITKTKTTLFVDRYVNNRFKGTEQYSITEYSFLRQCITDNMSALGAIRDWDNDLNGPFIKELIKKD